LPNTTVRLKLWHILNLNLATRGVWLPEYGEIYFLSLTPGPLQPTSRWESPLRTFIFHNTEVHIHFCLFVEVKYVQRTPSATVSITVTTSLFTNVLLEPGKQTYSYWLKQGKFYFDVRTLHFVQFTILTNKYTTYT
jgi:hypothetical protein